MDSADLGSDIEASERMPRRRAARLRVRGWVRHPLDLDATDLERLDVPTLVDFVVACTHDGPHGEPRRLRGVRLRALVTAAEPAFEQRTDFKRVALVVHATEGYRALFSWGELFNTAVGDGVLVGWDCAEAPLPEASGSFVLVSLHDRFTGPRYVRRLETIEVLKLW